MTEVSLQTGQLLDEYMLPAAWMVLEVDNQSVCVVDTVYHLVYRWYIARDGIRVEAWTRRNDPEDPSASDCVQLAYHQHPPPKQIEEWLRSKMEKAKHV